MHMGSACGLMTWRPFTPRAPAPRFQPQCRSRRSWRAANAAHAATWSPRFAGNLGGRMCRRTAMASDAFIGR